MADAQQNGEGKQLSPPRCRVAHAWISDAVYEQLERAGQRDRKHPDQLVAELVTTVYGVSIGG